MIKLAVFNEDTGRESKQFTVILPASTKPLFKHQCINELRYDVYNIIENGWINEYDLTYSTTKCVNKHDI